MSLLDNFPHRSIIRRRIAAKDELGGISYTYLNEQTGVYCWEQNASHKEILEYDKRGMVITKKVYFLEDPGLGERHQVLISERNGATIASPVPLDVVSEALPDASAGLGVVYKVMCIEHTGEDD